MTPVVPVDPGGEEPDGEDGGRPLNPRDPPGLEPPRGPVLCPEGFRPVYDTFAQIWRCIASTTPVSVPIPCDSSIVYCASPWRTFTYNGTVYQYQGNDVTRVKGWRETEVSECHERTYETVKWRVNFNCWTPCDPQWQACAYEFTIRTLVGDVNTCGTVDNPDTGVGDDELGFEDEDPPGEFEVWSPKQGSFWRWKSGNVIAPANECNGRQFPSGVSPSNNEQCWLDKKARGVIRNVVFTVKYSRTSTTWPNNSGPYPYEGGEVTYEELTGSIPL